MKALAGYGALVLFLLGLVVFILGWFSWRRDQHNGGNAKPPGYDDDGAPDEDEPPLTTGDLLGAAGYMLFIALLVFGPELARTLHHS